MRSFQLQHDKEKRMERKVNMYIYFHKFKLERYHIPVEGCKATSPRDVENVERSSWANYSLISPVVQKLPQFIPSHPISSGLSNNGIKALTKCNITCTLDIPDIRIPGPWSMWNRRSGEFSQCITVLGWQLQSRASTWRPGAALRFGRTEKVPT